MGVNFRFRTSEEKEHVVHSIFSCIAHKYDVLNTLLSFAQDKYWRVKAVEKAGINPGDYCLDVCCGTGKLTQEIAKAVGVKGRVVGLDFNEAMLDMARVNAGKFSGKDRVEFIHGNALSIPFPDNTFNCVMMGFGLRNVPDLQGALQEMIRVVKPGGRIITLEFGKPTTPFWKQVYNLYFDNLVPFLGRLGVGREGPYHYLVRSVQRFVHQDELLRIFSELNLKDVRCFELTGGVVAIHVGEKKRVQSPSPKTDA